jgi:predicted PurR-regulated permease PerM
MDQNQRSHNYLLVGIAIVLVIVFFIIRPFLGPLILAAIFAFLFHPLYEKLLNLFRKRESLSALLTTFMAIVLIVLPLVLFGTQIFKESSELYQSLFIESGNGITEFIRGAISKVDTIVPIPEYIGTNFNQYARQGLEFLIGNFGAIFSSFAKLIINIFIFIIAFYFFLKDGRKLKDYFVDLSPLSKEDDEFIISRLKSAVSATTKGSLLIGLIQGISTGVGFAIFGVPNAALWGGVAAVSALIPGVGTALIITPAIVFLFLTGHIPNGIGLLIWGITAVGLVDSFLGPRLIGRGMKLHPLVVFLSVLGGLALFGPLGFIVGPLTMSIFLTLIDIHLSFNNKKNQ